mmetsp:Transcript_47659/g.118017  ORF Transcript_47659/g.118017 Transcript_47659/m.118017 type:complete len:223 (+) Transcript_47659:658-1326(+)
MIVFFTTSRISLNLRGMTPDPGSPSTRSKSILIASQLVIPPAKPKSPAASVHLAAPCAKDCPLPAAAFSAIPTSMIEKVAQLLSVPLFMYGASVAHTTPSPRARTTRNPSSRSARPGFLTPLSSCSASSAACSLSLTMRLTVASRVDSSTFGELPCERCERATPEAVRLGGIMLVLETRSRCCSGPRLSPEWCKLFFSASVRLSIRRQHPRRHSRSTPSWEQ